MEKRDIIFNNDHSQSNELVVVFFKDCTRTPMYGFFVKMYDHEHLVEKKMVRFVSRSMDLAFIAKPITANTRIYSLASFKNFK